MIRKLVNCLLKYADRLCLLLILIYKVRMGVCSFAGP